MIRNIICMLIKMACLLLLHCMIINCNNLHIELLILWMVWAYLLFNTSWLHPPGLKGHVDPDWGGGGRLHGGLIEPTRQLILCAKAGSFSCFCKESTMPLTWFCLISFTLIGLKPCELKQTFANMGCFSMPLGKSHDFPYVLTYTHVVMSCLCPAVIIIRHLFILKCWLGFCSQVVSLFIVPVLVWHVLIFTNQIERTWICKQGHRLLVIKC